MGNRVYVGNLSFDTPEDGVRKAFAAHGNVTEVKIVTDRATGRPRGFAFVTMGTDEEAAQAIAKLNGTMLDGRSLRVNEAEQKPDRQGGFGGGGGGGYPGGGGGGGFDRKGGGGGGRSRGGRR